MDGHDITINGVPVFRRGDQVFLIGKLPTAQDMMDERLELMQHSWDSYRCPFSIIDEFEQWWQWHERLHNRKQSTGHIITTMLSDIPRIKAHKIEPTLSFRVRHSWNHVVNLSTHAIYGTA